MPIVEAGSVRERLGAQDSPAILASIEAAIEGAQTVAEQKFSFSATKGSRTDYFMCDPSYRPTIDGLYRLRLTYALVRPAAPLIPGLPGKSDTPAVILEVHTAPTMGELLKGQGTLVPATETIFDYEKGYVMLPSDNDIPAAFKVFYSYGTTKAAEAPAWLKEFIILQAIYNMSFHQVTNRNAEYDKVAAEIQKQCNSVVDSKARNLPFAALPVL